MEDYRHLYTTSSYFRSLSNKESTNAIKNEIEKEMDNMPIDINTNETFQQSLQQHKVNRALATRRQAEPWLANVYNSMSQIQIQSHQKINKPMKKAKEQSINKWLKNNGSHKKQSPLRQLYNNNIPNQHLSLPLYMKTQNPRDIRIRTAFRLNRVKSNDQLYKMNMAVSPMCPHCLIKPETRDHILLYCPQYQQAREPTFDIARELDRLCTSQFILAPEQIPTINNTDIINRIYNTTNELLKTIYNALRNRK
jgi:hypothetical protein